MKSYSFMATYARLAPLYDLMFGRSLNRGRTHAVLATNGHAGRVLEVGVGTGISLPAYRKQHEITGIDISPQMLEIARARVVNLGLSNVKDLIEMDASRLTFPDNSFEVVVAMYVMSVVDSPIHVLREIERVCVQGGRVIMINHFASKNGLRANAERRLVPIGRTLGWRMDFSMDEILSNTSLNLLGMHRVGPFGLYTLLRFAK